MKLLNQRGRSPHRGLAGGKDQAKNRQAFE